MGRDIWTGLFLLFFIFVAHHSPSFKENHNWLIMKFNNPETNYIPVSVFSNDSIRLVYVSEVPYSPPQNKSFLYAGNIVAWSWEITLGERLLKIGDFPVTINIDASFPEEHYFVIPNIKGLCNRLQIFAGIYILSSYYHIRILLSKSMLWKRLWNLTELFPGQFIELPDAGTNKWKGGE